ncbi:SDR family oxidoreductase [Corallococcus sp. AB049A]|uniref:SDR family oxidoreductase n=1 Tax=Corallococcus interemptor TaxID=2316720 RepID=A0A3A8R5C1_9BACT|nr:MULTISPECIES: SDR family oxidoreductase [Corallococcus]RKH44916.1 SDR family oxidoreductase [Corallococcus sp. AB050B]RKH70574.1 SDR family oxidoreductase [Corallococcus interemptor]RKI52937.1 SDR family oxidoreductase [Corallococcus sp. AB049A]
MRYVITGASRGIGFEFVQQLLRRGETVDAGVRAPELARRLEPLLLEAGSRLRIHPLDVTRPESVQAFAERICREPVDVLINNAGVAGQWSGLHELDYEDLARTIEVNALGPLRITSALLPALRHGTGRKVAHVTSRMGSLSSNTEGGAYAYRMSKAALNMGVRSMSNDLRREGLACVLLHPGWVQTDMGGQDAPLPPEESVRGMLRVIDSISLEHSGRFFDYEGAEVPW